MGLCCGNSNGHHAKSQETEREVSDDREGKEVELHQGVKQDAVKLVIEHGCSPQEAGRRRGIACAHLWRWVRLRRDQQQQGESGMVHRKVEEENRRLKKENQRLWIEREIYKKYSLRKGRAEVRLHPTAQEGLVSTLMCKVLGGGLATL